MAKQTIDVGTSANDGTGDTLRAAGTKINANFTETYDAIDALGDGLDDKQDAAPSLTVLAGVTPIADGPHTVGGITITTMGGLITAIS